MENRILEELLRMGLLKKDGTRLLGLINLIESNKNTPWVNVEDNTSFIYGSKSSKIEYIVKSCHSKIPLSIFSASGFTYSDIKLLQKIGEMTESLSFVVLNKNYFEVNTKNYYQNTQKHPEEIREEQENVLIQLGRFQFWNIKETLGELIKQLPENNGRVILHIKGSEITRDHNGETLCCRFKDEQGPISMIYALLKSTDPKKGSSIVGPSKNWSRTMDEINKKIKGGLVLTYDLVVNDGGYMIDRQRYEILQNKNT